MQLSAGGIRPLAGYRVVVALLFVGACSHADAFTYTRVGDEGPFAPGPPVRLTYNVLDDYSAAWLPDGSGLLYSYTDAASASRDRCLGLLPPAGGQIVASRCSIADARDDSTDAFTDATPLEGDRLAWVEQHALRTRFAPDYGGIMLGTLNRFQPAQRLVALPYVAVSGNVHSTAGNLRRLSPTTLAYVGVDLVRRTPCMNCKPDTLMVWHEMMTLSTTGGAPVMLPNSDLTTSIWPDADGTGLYFSIAGDHRVFHRELAGGADTVVHDFGSTGIVRDVSVIGDRLAAVVGGKVTFDIDALLGPLQVDSGGRLFTVDLGSGDEQEHQVPATTFRRPVLSPDGRSLVAEGVDSTSTLRTSDLWLFRLP